jgi:ribonuclease P protein component
MLPGVNRLNKNEDFDDVKTKGRMYQSDNFGVSVLARKDKKPSRFGFVISTKISKMAVHRNRVARALREAVRQNLKFFPDGYDCVFLAKKSITSLSTEQIMKEVVKFISKREFAK